MRYETHRGTPTAAAREALRREGGYTAVQLMVVVAIIATLSVFAFMRIESPKNAFKLQNSVRQLAGYLEKARLDAIRRHDTATVTFNTSSTYTVNMDFDGSGVKKTRTYTMEDGVGLPPGSPLPSVFFNWRGRTNTCTNTFAFQDTSGLQSWIDVSDAGDVTINSDVDVLPTVTYTAVATNANVATNAVVSGSTVRTNTADCSTGSGATATTGPPVTGTGTGNCQITANYSSISIKKQGGSTGSVTLTANANGGGSVTVSAPPNLTVSPKNTSIANSGTAPFSITSNNKTRGTFAVTFSTSCTSVTVLVAVTN